MLQLLCTAELPPNPSSDEGLQHQLVCKANLATAAAAAVGHRDCAATPSATPCKLLFNLTLLLLLLLLLLLARCGFARLAPNPLLLSSRPTNSSSSTSSATLPSTLLLLLLLGAARLAPLLLLLLLLSLLLACQVLHILLPKFHK
jgi:hypothetical protein